MKDTPPMKALIALAVCGCASAQIDRPQLGKMLDSTGAVRTIYGIAASVTLGDAELTGVVSMGCSKQLCLAKTEASILWPGGMVDAPVGPALFAFDGDAAYIWFTRSRRLARWQDGVLAPIAGVDLDGAVLSIRASSGVVEFAVRRMNGVWILRQDGSVLNSLPRFTGPVMLIPGEIVYASPGEIVVGEVRIPLHGVTSFSQMSGNYLQVRAAGIDYSLRTEKGRETLFQLPGVPQ